MASLVATGLFAAAAQARGAGRATRTCRPITLSDAGVQMLKLARAARRGRLRRAPRSRPCRRTWTSPACSRCSTRRRFPRSCRTRGMGFSSALWSQVGAQAVVKMKAAGGALEGTRVHRRARRRADADEELPRRRHPRRRPRVRQRHRAVVHRPARRVRLAHRVRDDRPRRARDRGRRHGRRAHGGADEDGLGQPAAGVFAGGGRDRVHVVRAQQPGPVDRVGGRRARAARVEAAGPEHGRGLVAERAQSIALTLSHEGNSEIYRISPERRPASWRASPTTPPSTARRRSRPTARRSRSCRTGRARRRSS